jgi:hypothetical protein
VACRGWLVEGGLSFDGDDLPAGQADLKYPKLLGSLIRLHGRSSIRGRDPRVVGVFDVANLACDLGDRAGDTRSPGQS